MTDFAASLADNRSHVVADLAPDSEAMLILFGGIAGGVSMPPFEFFRLTAGYPTKKLYLRDPNRSWYLLGLPGVGASADALSDYLGAQIASSGVRRVVMAGASAGGFAALLFGTLLAVDEVHAFSPQTFIDEPNRLRHGDERWPDQITALHARLGPAAPFSDLAPLLRTSTVASGRHLHFCRDDALDVTHAHHIAATPGVVLHGYDGGGHKLVKWLRNNGTLERLLRDALKVDPS